MKNGRWESTVFRITQCQALFLLKAFKRWVFTRVATLFSYFHIPNPEWSYIMKKFSLKAIALLVAMSASSAFAAGGADFDPTANFGDITAITSDSVATEISGALADTFDVATGVYAQNVALIAQVGDGNFALIDQQGGTANFAGVIQDASANGANVAVIQQTGNFNRAFVNQH